VILLVLAGIAGAVAFACFACAFVIGGTRQPTPAPHPGRKSPHDVETFAYAVHGDEAEAS
jgi:hypothetical protein